MKRAALIGLSILLWITASNGQSLNFPAGISGYRVDIGDLDIGGNAITIEALVTLQPGDYHLMDIVCKHLGPKDMNYLLRASRFMIRTDKGIVDLPNPVVLCPNTTYHVAGSYDGSMARYFVNGVQVASKPWSGTLQLNNNKAAIGNMWNQAGTYNEQFRGYIDEVRIWKTARSQQEIAANMYNLSNPAAEPGLLAYYKFDGDYKNLQGNAAWNGQPRSKVALASNPYFKGAVISSFCGGDDIFKSAAAKLGTSQPVVPIPLVAAPKPAALPVQPIYASIEKGALAPIKPIPGKPRPDCDNIIWASWGAPTGKSATGTFNNGGKTVTVTMSADYQFTTDYIWHHQEFDKFPSKIPNTKVPSTTWTDRVHGTTTMCFSEPVDNPVMMIASLGQTGTKATIKFSKPYKTLYSTQRIRYDNSTTITGNEGNGVVMFPGKISCITVTCSDYERFTYITWGVKVCPNVVPAPQPVPPPVAEKKPEPVPPPKPKPVPPPVPVAKEKPKPAPVMQPKPSLQPLPVKATGSSVQIWDFDCNDYDSVFVTFNGKQIGQSPMMLPPFKGLEKLENTYQLETSAGENTLEITAVSEGVNPLTTVGLFIIHDGKRRQVFYKLKLKEKMVVKL